MRVSVGPRKRGLVFGSRWEAAKGTALVVLQLALQLRGLRWPASRVELCLTRYGPGALLARWVFSFSGLDNAGYQGSMGPGNKKASLLRLAFLHLTRALGETRTLTPCGTAA